jgi:hypothetical protein
LGREAADLRVRLTLALESAKVEELDPLAGEAQAVLTQTEDLERMAAALPGAEPEPAGVEQGLAKVLETVDRLTVLADQLMKRQVVGLTPVDIAVDDAMLTSVALRLDLMNERGFLADDRRAVKLAADDLRSILNLGVTQVIGTRRNRPFGFAFDESTTHVGAALDLPLNRQAQRNRYRQALINFHAGRRSLMRLEDSIKLAVRDDLRNLALARNQYGIGVASAALANQRVTSTRVELALGFAGVAARDFLEAQDAYRVAIGGVADNHLGYVVNRMQFFLDLELLEVDETGFWPGLRDDRLQPAPAYALPPEAGPAYGPLPPRLRLSPEIRSLHPH